MAEEKSCKLVATWMKICRRDFACVGTFLKIALSFLYTDGRTVGIAFFILYVLFGVTPTIKAFQWCRRRLSGAPKAAPKDVEDVDCGASAPARPPPTD